MPTFRKPVNKAKSAKQFRRNVSRTKAINTDSRGHAFQQGVSRGGIRL